MDCLLLLITSQYDSKYISSGASRQTTKTLKYIYIKWVKMGLLQGRNMNLGCNFYVNASMIQPSMSFDFIFGQYALKSRHLFITFCNGILIENFYLCVVWRQMYISCKWQMNCGIFCVTNIVPFHCTFGSFNEQSLSAGVIFARDV